MRIPKEVIEYAREIAAGKSPKEMSDLINEKFKNKGVHLNEEQVKTMKCRYKIKSGKKGFVLDRIYGPEFHKFVKKEAVGRYNDELAELVNKRFNASLTVGQVTTYKKKNKIKSGIDPKFKPGHETWCKGKKMPEGWGGETRFKKGSVPKNKKDIGTESVQCDGYIIVKVSETGNQRVDWKFKHIAVWEEHNGPVPDGNMIIFLDGNIKNCSIENLAMVTKSEHLELVRRKLRFKDAELTKTAITISKINIAIREKRGGKN